MAWYAGQGGYGIPTKSSPKNSGHPRALARSALAVGGIALFATGFIITVNSLRTSADVVGSAAASSTLSIHSSSLLVIGFVTSLAGLGLATIGPAVLFVRARRAMDKTED